jgi:ribosomal protein S18 acetylase RimI-like enzyme/uridine phosphorylase
MAYLITPQQTLSAARQAGLHNDDLNLSGIAVVTFSKPVIDRLDELCGLEDAAWISPPHHPYAAARVVKRGQFQGLGITALVPPMGASPLACIVEDLVACGLQAIFLVCAAWSLGPPVEFGDLIVPAFSMGRDGTSIHYDNREGEVRAQPEVVDALAEACRARHARVHVGGNGSCEALYRITPQLVEYFRHRGCLCMENGEASTVFAIARTLGVLGGVLFHPYVDLTQGWDPGPLRDRRYRATCRLQAEVVLEAGAALLQRRRRSPWPRGALQCKEQEIRNRHNPEGLAGIELSRLSETRLSVHEILDEYTRLGVERRGERLRAMVKSFRDAIRAEEVDGWVARQGDRALGLAVCTRSEGDGRINFIHVLLDCEEEDLAARLTRKTVNELRRSNVRRITCETITLNYERQIRKAFKELGFRSLERVTMSLDLRRSLPEPVTPSGYELIPWSDDHMCSVIQLIYDANAGTVDQLVYPEMKTLEGTGRMIQAVRSGATAPFDEEASLIALHEGAPCGGLLFTRSAANQGFAAAMAVAEAHQRKGLGKALLTQALLAAQAQGVEFVELAVTAENTPAVHLYRRFGFTPKQRVTAHIWEA